MNPVTRTTGPLHFEDLEPHRFEDLIRQLVYRSRLWESLDATGALGNDSGIDILGVERVSISGSAPNQLAFGKREWRIQCKRVTALYPSEMRRILHDLVRDGKNPPYGVIIAAACDISGETLNIMRTEAAAKGVVHSEAWTGRHIEDLLRRPTNRDLLFCYFGIPFDPREDEAVDCVIAILNELQHNLVALELWEPFAGTAIERTHYRRALGQRSFTNLPPNLTTVIAAAYAKLGSVEEQTGRRSNFPMGFPDARHLAYEGGIGRSVEAAMTLIKRAHSMIESYLKP